MFFKNNLYFSQILIFISLVKNLVNWLKKIIIFFNTSNLKYLEIILLRSVFIIYKVIIALLLVCLISTLLTYILLNNEALLVLDIFLKYKNLGKKYRLKYEIIILLISK